MSRAWRTGDRLRGELAAVQRKKEQVALRPAEDKDVHPIPQGRVRVLLRDRHPVRPGSIRAKGSRKSSLDKIICDPDLAAEFDKIAARLAPGFSPLDYRWVALGVRKAAGRYASKAGEAKVLSFSDFASTLSIRASKISTNQGVYCFRCEEESLFIGETENLRHRLERHFEGGGPQGLPEWLYERGSRVISLCVVPTPALTPVERKIIEVGAVQTYEPHFNYVVGQRA